MDLVKLIVAGTALGLCSSGLLAPSQTTSHQRGALRGVFVPKDGFVPNANVAVLIAEAVLVPVYGAEMVASERPFKATLRGGVWVVKGSVPCENPPRGAVCPGGTAEVRLAKKTGQILHMKHDL